MRMILYKQDQISLLEAELHAIDNSEERPLFLGARRRDQNQERSAKLQQLDTALIEYGTSHFFEWLHLMVKLYPVENYSNKDVLDEATFRRTTKPTFRYKISDFATIFWMISLYIPFVSVLKTSFSRNFGLKTHSLPSLHFQITDRLLESGEQNTRRKQPAFNDVETLKNWFQNEGFLAREETKYLSHMDGLDKGHDLLTLHELSDLGMHSLGRHIERLLVKILKRFKKVFYFVASFKHRINSGRRAISDLKPLLPPTRLSWSLTTSTWR